MHFFLQTFVSPYDASSNQIASVAGKTLALVIALVISANLLSACPGQGRILNGAKRALVLARESSDKVTHSESSCP